MKQGFKLLTVLFLTLLLAISAAAQINWLKQDGSTKYLAWDNGSNSKTIYNGNSATFATGYFGSTASQTVHLTATINSKADGKIVSTLVSKDVNVGNSLGYEAVTVLPAHYKNKAGEYIIVIKVKDANSELVDSSLFLKVNANFITEIVPIPFPIDTNDAPEMNNVPNKQVNENKNLQFTVSGTDADNDGLTYEAKVCFKVGSTCLWFSPSFYGAAFNENTGQFSWTPGYDFVKHPSLSRAVDFRFRADDGDEKSTWEVAAITVKDANRNPKFDNIPNKVVQEEQLLQFTVNATDADNDELTYSVLSGLPPGAGFDPEAQQFKWIPTDAQAGIYFVTFKVVDNFGGKDLENVLIAVTNVVKPQCDDNLDNDGDSKKDENDPGCHTDGNLDNDSSYDPNDNDETDEAIDEPECKDGKDNDGDSKIDFPNDPGCDNQDDDNEGDEPECKDGKDNDNDGFVDLHDPGCENEDDDNEDDTQEDKPQCDDGLDNDGDHTIDLDDPGCFSPEDDNENDDPYVPQCSDGADNDHDGYTDYAQDTGCLTPDDNNENNYITPEEDSSHNIDLQLQSAHLENEVLEAGNNLFINVRVFNDGDEDFDELKVQAKIFDLGIWGSTGKFTLDSGKDKNSNVVVFIPEDAQPGWHLVKVIVKNSHYHTSTYRLVYIKSNTFK